MSDMIFKAKRTEDGALICDRRGTVALMLPWAKVERFFKPGEHAVYVNGWRRRSGVRLSHRVRDRAWPHWLLF